MRVCIIDTGSANLNSVNQALLRLNIDCVISNQVDVLRTADKLILPGVGSASFIMNGILKYNLNTFIKECRKPLLGICLGMQVMGADSEEVPLGSDESSIKTLGLIPEKVRRLKAGTLRLPHMGWDTVEHNDHPLFAGIKNGAYFYFVHTYRMDLGEHTIGSCTYGEKFTAALARDNFLGVQFHPEKSGAVGAKLLANFINL